MKKLTLSLSIIYFSVLAGCSESQQFPQRVIDMAKGMHNQLTAEADKEILAMVEKKTGKTTLQMVQQCLAMSISDYSTEDQALIGEYYFFDVTVGNVEGQKERAKEIAEANPGTSAATAQVVLATGECFIESIQVL